MFCSKCGSSNPDGAAFCVSCGERLASAIPNPNAAQAPNQAQPTNQAPVQPQFNQPNNQQYYNPNFNQGYYMPNGMPNGMPYNQMYGYNGMGNIPTRRLKYKRSDTGLKYLAVVPALALLVMYAISFFMLIFNYGSFMHGQAAMVIILAYIIVFSILVDAGVSMSVYPYALILLIMFLSLMQSNVNFVGTGAVMNVITIILTITGLIGAIAMEAKWHKHTMQYNLRFLPEIGHIITYSILGVLFIIAITAR